MQKFPKIISYLEVHRPDVFELFDLLGMHADLNPKNGGSITFLCPSAKLTEKIKEVINGPEPENATDMIGALILTDLYLTSSDMIDVEVRTHTGKVLPVKRIGSSEVVLNNNAVLRTNVDPPFIPFDRKGTVKRKNMSVWNYEGEMYDYENASLADDSNKVKKPTQPKPQVKVPEGIRKRFIKSVFNAAVPYYAVNSNEFIQKDGVNNPFVRAMACILSVTRNDFVQLSRVMPFIHNPCRAVSFYALVTLTSDEVLAQTGNWSNNKAPYDYNTITACMDEWMVSSINEEPKPFLASKEGQDHFYNFLLRFIKDTPKSNLIHKKETQTIDNFISSNRIANLQNILPKLSAQSVRENPSLFKIANYVSFELVNQLEEETGGENKNAVSEALKEIERYFTGSKETLTARVEGHESYDARSTEFANESWQHVKRLRFTNSLLTSLPMHFDVANKFCGKELPEETVVKIKCESSAVTGSNDVNLSSTTRNELKEFLRRGGNLEEFKLH